MKTYVHLVGRRTVVGRGSRRLGLLVLLALPVLLSTLAAGLFSSVAPSAEQRATSTLGRADGYVTHADPEVTGKLAQTLRQQAPGMDAIPIDDNSDFPVWANDRTVSVHYTDTDWSSPVTHGRYRLLEGRFPAKLGEIAVSRALADTHGLSLGGSLPYRWKRDAPARIVGLVENPQAHAAFDYLAAPGQLRAWPKTGADSTNVLPSGYGLLLAGDAPRMEVAQRIISEQGMQLETRSTIADSRTMIEREPALILAPGVVVLGVIAAGAFALRMRRTRSEFAILAGLGVPDRDLRHAAVSGAVSAGMIAVPAGWFAGTLLALLARPVLPRFTDKDVAPYDPLLIGGALTFLLSVAVSALAAALTSQYPAGLPARERARVTPRPGKPARLWAPVLYGAAALGIAIAVAFREDETLSAAAAVAAIASLAAAVLTRIGDVLRILARWGDRTLSARIALRAFARDPRRPVSAIVIGSVALALTIGILGTLSSVTAQSRATYIGSRHLDQVEALLYSGSDAEAVERALVPVFPEGTPIVRGSYPVDKKMLEASASPALTPPWSVAWQAGGEFAARTQMIEVVDDDETFTALTGRSWSPRENKALKNGRILVLAPEYIKGDRVTLSRPTSLPGSTEETDTRRSVGGAVLSDPVDATTLTRASAYITTRTAHALGATTVDYSVIAAPTGLASDVEERLVKALEPVDVVMSDVRIETGPETTPPALWYLLLGLALAAVVTVLGITITSSATELRPDLVRLHRIGLSPGTLRRIVIWQSVTIGLVAAVLGGATGWGLAAARNWPGGIPVVMNWTAVATVLALTLVLSAAYGALAAPRHVGNTLNRTET
ncbi:MULTISPECIES: ABC transporter permease family protein [Streptomyces]|uniref:FtsX-like permease family protein n=1 Tax=Streptomyces TaxID=1883 RepID=UPI0004C07A18|nr:FtsX-like permease family protein [Streptomyces californicus]QRV57095.1 FtsX-like permease family protein [Streptomyces californicus]